MPSRPTPAVAPPLPGQPATAATVVPAGPAVHRLLRPIYNLHVRLRTEGDSPGRQAAAVGIGLFVGCSPFYGLHLAICVALASLLRLNRIQTYLAAQISVPVVAPFLLLGEIEAGRLLRGAGWLPLDLAALRRLNPWQFGLDLVTGSLVVGGVLGALAAAITWHTVRRLRREPEKNALIDDTARRYVESGPFAWEFVRGKLRYDPVYFHLLQGGGLPREGRLCDLGCGRGIVLALLATARGQEERGTWPAGWPAPPRLSLAGIEGRRSHAEIAAKALGGEAEVAHGDLRSAGLPEADLFLLLDVLHYLGAAAQEALLDRIATALPPGGTLLLRDADAQGGARFAATRVQERLCALARGHFRQRFHYRTATAWMELLEKRGLTATREPMAMGTPYANVLIRGVKRAG